MKIYLDRSPGIFGRPDRRLQLLLRHFVSDKLVQRLLVCRLLRIGDGRRETEDLRLRAGLGTGFGRFADISGSVRPRSFRRQVNEEGIGRTLRPSSFDSDQRCRSHS